MVRLPCFRCKGRDPSICGRSFCPILAQKDVKIKIIDKIDKEFFGNSPPTIFIGSKLHYPAVNVGILSPLDSKDEAWKYDNPVYWYKNNYDIKRIIGLRTSLINSRFKANVFDVRNSSGHRKFLDAAQEIGMANRPAGVEVELKNKLKSGIRMDDVSLPMGPAGEIRKVRITENIKIHAKVEKVASDTDLKAVDAVRYLWKRGFNEHALSQLLSIGVLGVGKNRKLVPTRWSITGIDDALGKDLIDEVEDYKIIDEYTLFFGNYFGNYYLIFLFPELWSYELFESYMPKSLWNPNEELVITTDYEDYEGRKIYAENCGGGYYSARLPVLEFLKRIKRQASVLMLRFATPDYTMPLGVWVVRQAVRRTLCSKCLRFSEEKSMLNTGKEIALRMFNYNVDNILGQSKLLKNKKEQMKLTSFFGYS